LRESIISWVRADLIRRGLVEEPQLSKEKPRRWIITPTKDDKLLAEYVELCSDHLEKYLFEPVRAKIDFEISDIQLFKVCLLIASVGDASGWVYRGLLEEVKLKSYNADKIILALLDQKFVLEKETIKWKEEREKDKVLMGKLKGAKHPHGIPSYDVYYATPKLYLLLANVMKKFDYLSSGTGYLCAAIVYRKEDQAVLVMKHPKEIEDSIPKGTIPYVLPGDEVKDKSIFYDDKRLSNFLKHFFKKTFKEEVEIEDLVFKGEWRRGAARIPMLNERLEIRVYSANLEKHCSTYKRQIDEEFPISLEDDRRQLKAMWKNIFEAQRILPHPFSQDAISEYLLKRFEYFK